MKKTRALLLSIAVAVLALGVAAAPTYAVENNTDSSTSPNGVTTTTQNRDTETDTPRTTTSGGGLTPLTEAEHAQQVKAHEAEARNQAETLLKDAEQTKTAAEKQAEAAKTAAEKAAERLKNCQELKDGLQTKVDEMVKNAQSYKNRVDEIYSKALSYQKTNNLTIDAALITAANTAQAQAAVSVQALAGVKPTVDCNSTTVASDVAVFKAAATQARNDLQAYKLTVKNVLTALEAAKQ